MRQLTSLRAAAAAAATGACSLALVACGSAHSAPATATAAPGATASISTTTSASTGARAQRARSTVPDGAAQDWPEFGYDPQRSDAGPASTGITGADLGSLRKRTVTLGGIADSSAIALNDVTVDGHRRDVIVVTTSYGLTSAIDATTGRQLWRYRPSGVNMTPGNPQVTTASPVADPDDRSVYAAAPTGRVVKLSLATGHVQWSRAITLYPLREKIASALNVSGPWVVAVTGGYDGDIPPYDGHVVTISRSTGRIGHVWNSECSSRHRLIEPASCSVTNTRGDDAMWGRAGAVIVPGSGDILTATGNGPFNGRTDWGNSALELSADAARLIHNWTPTNQAYLDHNDVDVGSASPALLPEFHGWHLAVQGGKDGRLHVLDVARLDGTTGPASARLGGELDETDTPGSGELLTAPAVWSHDGQILLFAGTDSGTALYRLVDPGHPRLQTVWEDTTPATSPVIAGGLLYAYDETGGSLDVRAPLSGRLLRSFPVPAGHWNSPIVSAGRVILPTGSYHDASSTSTLVILHLPGR